MDLDPQIPKAVWGFNGTERPGAVYLACMLTGNIVTHEQLAEALEDRTATTGKIQKLVSALRSVLDGLGLTDAIRTERGIGYALEACN